METPITAQETAEVVRSAERVRIVGGGSKRPLVEIRGGDSEPTDLSTAALTGVIAYEPGEYTITAAAGTSVYEIEELLAENGQYLPFDPMRSRAGATLGGTVAAAAHGPGRMRFGGVRDFLLGVRMVDGTGTLVSGGGRVVKNAAGFDLPKLMVGSAGGLGVLVDLTFKVFPRPPEWCSLRVRSHEWGALVGVQRWLVERAYDFAGLELEKEGSGGGVLWLRLAGLEGVARERVSRVTELLACDATLPELDVGLLTGEEEERFWSRARELDSDSDSGRGATAAWIRAATRPSKVESLESALDEVGLAECRRCWSAGAQSLWILLSPHQLSHIETLDRLLAAQQVAGQVFMGAQGGRALGTARPGVGPANPFGERLLRALDPGGRFGTS